MNNTHEGYYTSFMMFTLMCMSDGSAYQSFISPFETLKYETDFKPYMSDADYSIFINKLNYEEANLISKTISSVIRNKNLSTQEKKDVIALIMVNPNNVSSLDKTIEMYLQDRDVPFNMFADIHDLKTYGVKS